MLPAATEGSCEYGGALAEPCRRPGRGGGTVGIKFHRLSAAASHLARQVFGPLSMRPKPRSLIVTLVISLVAQLSAVVHAAPPAPSCTRIPGATYTTNVTWRAQDSPIVLDGNVLVGSGATLTINPGVVVKFNGAFRALTVWGNLSAVGTSASRITFTSIQDDSDGVDCGGDGSSSGAPGQWLNIAIDSGNSNTTFDYANVRYGGNGSTDWGYGAIRVAGTSRITVDHANITDNQRSGITIGDGCGTCGGPGATVKNSLVARNAYGISAINGWFALEAGNTVAENRGNGVFYNLTSNYTGPKSTVTRSDIARNGASGVRLQVDSGLPTSLWPSGSKNNIYDNAAKQLSTHNRNRSVDWTGNFWGTDVSFQYNSVQCLGVLLNSRGRLTRPGGVRVIDGFQYLATSQGPTCEFDDIKIEPWEFSRDYLDGAGDLPPGAILGSGDGLHAQNPAGFQLDPVNSASGGYYTTATDLRLSGIGVPFAFTRSYNSLDATSGPLGPGWTHAYAAALTIKPSGDVVLRAEDGQQVEYTRQGDGSFVGMAGTLSPLTEVTGGYELVRRDQVRYRFDTSGLLTSIRDRNGQGLSFAYASGKLSTITDSAGRAITLSYNAEGLLSQVALPDGRSVGYAYTSGRLTSVTDARGGLTKYTYESHGWLRTKVDQNNNTVVTNTYDAIDGRVIEQLDARGKRSTFSWNPTTRTSTMVDARGKEWKDVYTEYALIKRIDPLGNTTEYGYDAQYNLTSVKDPRGNTTTMTYDGRGNMLSRTPPASLGYPAEAWTYTPLNDVNIYTDRKGNTTDFDYDPAGNLITVTRQPANVITRFGRDPAGTGLLKTITDPRGKVTTFDYDAAGNLTKFITPLGNMTTMGYDSSGRMTSLVEPRGNSPGADPAQFQWTYTYDATDHLLTQTDPLSNGTTWIYDPAGNVKSRKDAKLRTTSYDYDAANHLTSVTAPDTTVTSYGYDDVGNLISRTDAKTHITQYGYDAANRLTSVLSPTQQRWTSEYDAAGNLTKLVDANGNATPTAGDGTTIYGYDALNRLVSVNYSDATPDVTYAYDPASNRTSLTDGAGTETYTYDSLNRLKTVTRSRKSFAYDYDPADNLVKRTYPDGTVVDYTYDDDGRLESVASAGATTTYGYDEAGNLVRTTLPSANGYVESRTYDRAGRLTQVKNEKGGNALSRFTYTLDEVGNPTSVVTADGTITYAYDALYRLTEACFAVSCPGASDPYIRYAYDDVGNRTTETRPTGTTAYEYNDSDQLTSQGGLGGTVNYSYDANGNQTGPGNRTYDLANRLASTTAGGTTITYSYDGNGKRLQASSGSQAANKTNYLWDANAPLPLLIREADGRDNLLRRYVYGADLVSMTTGAGTFYYHYDGLGSVANLTSGSGTPQWSYTYEPFGSMRTEVRNDPSAPTNLMRFTGELFDTPTSLYHLRARQYDPVAGRFLQVDPHPQAMTDPYVAAYIYASDRPTVFVDPSGKVVEVSDDDGRLCDWVSCWILPELILGAGPGGGPEEIIFSYQYCDKNTRTIHAVIVSMDVDGNIYERVYDLGIPCVPEEDEEPDSDLDLNWAPTVDSPVLTFPWVTAA